jgi:hypothetical protein
MLWMNNAPNTSALNGHVAYFRKFLMDRLLAISRKHSFFFVLSIFSLAIN